MSEAISLMIHRKDGKLFVTPWVLSKVGFQCLDDLFVAKPDPKALEEALQQAAARVREATTVPRDQRFSDCLNALSLSQSPQRSPRRCSRRLRVREMRRLGVVASRTGSAPAPNPRRTS
jgi:hypothetical protein